MNQTNIRPYNNQTFTVDEAAAWLKELNDRTKSSQVGRNSINELATLVAGLVNNKLDKGSYTGTAADLKMLIDELGGFTIQNVDTGGNFNNLQLTGNYLEFTNTNGQAILTGFDYSKYRLISIINNGDFEIRLNSEDTNSDPDKRIQLPTGIANTGIQGSCTLIYMPSLQRWQIFDQFASKYRPEHRGLPDTQVEVVTSDARSETVPIIELEVFRDAQSSAMSKADLNTAYPDALRGFMVICKQIDLIYKKVDSNTNDWISLPLTAVS